MTMIKIIFFAGLIVGGYTEMVLANTSLMVERHIFTPDISAPSKESTPSPVIGTAAELEKEILFTGILITPNGRQVILSEQKKNNKEKQKHVYKAGDEINGMTIREIGSNYVMIGGAENPVRMNLYRGEKKRPALMPDHVQQATAGNGLNPSTGQTSTMTAGAQKPGSTPNMPAAAPTLPPTSQQNPVGQPVQVPSPFGGANSGNVEGSGETTGSPASGNPGTAPNPFGEIMKKAIREKPTNQNPIQFNFPIKE
ncbi:MAG: hypothetical protein WA151_05865 [Desulfatirhabdiaceae bacterium]